MTEILLKEDPPPHIGEKHDIHQQKSRFMSFVLGKLNMLECMLIWLLFH